MKLLEDYKAGTLKSEVTDEQVHFIAVFIF